MSRKLTDDERKAKGTFRPDRKDTAPNLTADKPKPTRKLTEDEKRHWDGLVARLEKQGTATEVDGYAVDQAVRCLVEIDRLDSVLNEHGQVYSTFTENGSEMFRARPEVAMLEQAWRRLQSALRDLGLTPATRTRVRQAPSKEQAPKADTFEGVLDRKERGGLRSVAGGKGQK